MLEAVEYEERDWISNFGTKNPGYTGTPTDDMEAKWANLVEGLPLYILIIKHALLFYTEAPI